MVEYEVNRAVAFAQEPYKYCPKEFCDEVVMIPLAGLIFDDRLRLELFNSGAAVC